MTKTEAEMAAWRYEYDHPLKCDKCDFRTSGKGKLRHHKKEVHAY